MIVDMGSTWGLCPQTPTPSAGPDFFTRGADTILILNPPRTSNRFIILYHPPGLKPSSRPA